MLDLLHVVVVVGSFFLGTERNTSAITSGDGFGVTIDFFEGNRFGKICCEITRGITADDEFSFTVTVG